MGGWDEFQKKKPLKVNHVKYLQPSSNKAAMMNEICIVERELPL